MSRAKMLMAAMVGVLAFSGFATAVASAATPGWMVNGTMLSGTTALATAAVVDAPLKLVGNTLEIECKSLNGVNAKINSSTNMGDADKLVFEECETVGPSSVTCALNTKTVTTEPVLVDATLDGALATKGRFLPLNTSKLFVNLQIVGAECGASGANAVTGYATWLDPRGQDELLWHLLTATNEEPGSLKIASSNAELKGSILVKLANDQLWSFL